MARQFNFAKVLYVAAQAHKLTKYAKGRKPPITATRLMVILCKLAEMSPKERTDFVRLLRHQPIANKLWKQLD